jgi:hypothetical protein
VIGEIASNRLGGNLARPAQIWAVQSILVSSAGAARPSAFVENRQNGTGADQTGLRQLFSQLSEFPHELVGFHRKGLISFDK